jgi:hypothetical protein
MASGDYYFSLLISTAELNHQVQLHDQQAQKGDMELSRA